MVITATMEIILILDHFKHARGSMSEEATVIIAALSKNRSLTAGSRDRDSSCIHQAIAE